MRKWHQSQSSRKSNECQPWTCKGTWEANGHNPTKFPRILLTSKFYLPDSVTADMFTPCSFAIKPSTEKMAKPATKLVKLFNRHSAIESLQRNTNKINKRVLSFKLFGQAWINNSQCMMTKKNSLTCRNHCCTCCSFLETWERLYKLRRRRKFDCQHPSTPEGFGQV